MKVVFLGTPDFGIPALEQISKHHQVLACVCQPDKVGSRGKTECCAVKQFAIRHNFPLYQFEKISRDGRPLKAYAAFYVPAIEDGYLERMPDINGRFN